MEIKSACPVGILKWLIQLSNPRAVEREPTGVECPSVRVLLLLADD